MYKIIGSGADSEIGGKALGLILLDKEGLTPDFIIIRGSWLELPEICSQANIPEEFDFSRKIKKRILSEISRLCPGPLIIRSSSSVEDSDYVSYAGCFSSEICLDRRDFFRILSKVCRSFYTAFYASGKTSYGTYSYTKKAVFSVIIQKYIKSELGGVLFTNCGGERNVYVEYVHGSPADVVSAKVVPMTYFYYLGRNIPSPEIDEKDMDWLEEISKKSLVISDGEKKDFEFAVSEGRIYFLQQRPVTADFDPFYGNYVLFSHSLFFSEEKNLPILNRWLQSIADIFSLKAPELVCEWGRILIPIDSMRYAAASARKFSYSEIISSAEKLHFFISDFFRKTTVLLNSCKDTGTLSLIFDEYSLKFLVLRIIVWGMYNWLSKDMCEKNDMAFAEKVDRFITGHEDAVSYGEYTEEEMSLLDPDTEKILAYHCLLNLIDRLDASVHCYMRRRIKKVSQVKKAKFFVSKRGSREILTFFFPAALTKSVPRTERFPLKGFIACAGNAAGRAYVFTPENKADSVPGKSIIVVDMLAGNLLSYVTGAAGIVIEHGGFLSHIAILAREMRIPCLVNCSGAMSSVRTGDYVEIKDGILRLKKAVAEK